MKITEIIQLLKAGYSKSEIAELRDAELANLPSESPASESAPEPEPDPAQAPAGPDPQIEELKQTVLNLQKLIQKQNVQTTARESVKPETAVDILAGIINPAQNNK